MPAGALQADGEAAYLAEFRAETLVDDRQPAAATSLAQVRHSPHAHTNKHTNIHCFRHSFALIFGRLHAICIIP